MRIVRAVHILLILGLASATTFETLSNAYNTGNFLYIYDLFTADIKAQLPQDSFITPLT